MIGRFLRVTLAAAALGIAPAAASVSSLVAEGNRLYQAGKLDEALAAYQQAARLAPSLPAVQYNIANVLYRKGEFEKAFDAYRKAFPAEDPRLAEGARFNAGNAHFARRNWQEAIQQYAEALRLDPKDLDAKRNLELALLNLEQEKKQQQQQKQDQKDEKNPDQPPPPSGGQDQPKDQEQKEKQANPSPDKESKPQEKLTRQEAMRLLDAMRRQDKMPKDPMKVPPPDKKPEKDW